MFPRRQLYSDSPTVSLDVFQGRDKLIRSLAVARRDDRGFRFADRVAQGARCSRTLDGRTQALQVGSARLLQKRGQRSPGRSMPCVFGRHLSASAGNAFLERSEEHTSELQSLMRISYAVFCLKKKIRTTHETNLTTARKQLKQQLTEI